MRLFFLLDSAYFVYFEFPAHEKTMSIFQPINQVRLTNVAVVRLKSYGYRFEVACYKNKVVNWRSGIETDLDEVLQSHTIFHNVSKGEYAKKETLMKVFKTTNATDICKRILDKGELQVSEKEREAALESIFRDVATLITEFAVNPQTGMPLSRSMIEVAMRELGCNLRLDEPAKKQALKVMEILQRHLPNQIARAFMRLRIRSKLSQRQQLYEFLCSSCAATIEVESPSLTSSSKDDGGYGEDPPAAIDLPSSSVRTPPNFTGDAPLLICPSPRSAGPFKGENFYKITFLCPPNMYRRVDEFVMEALKPSEDPLVERAIDAMSPHKNHLSFSSSTEDVSSLPSSKEEFSSVFILKEEESSSWNLSSPTRRIRCSTCNEFIESPSLYRLHCREKRHCINIKRKAEGLFPLDDETFLQQTAGRETI
ncbi:rRna metabolism protein, SBDS family protein [Cardiosporidium cionae]|uniref:RRna metabolism protein, SBDS family protein n=1 Tax=Cardiosporidium cionae TaxID=476202 RepID=A0ABQ7J8E0_9APIC|nr:rRna metabolism protein, SBDS family protein [Cardiosporidium cionae]|eukprot:KAF8820256.1 rRna metabolism protein, SBDS family protein [Cardiosporidium cionae]